MVEGMETPLCCCCIPIRVGVGILCFLDILWMGAPVAQSIQTIINVTAVTDYYKTQGTDVSKAVIEKDSINFDSTYKIMAIVFIVVAGVCLLASLACLFGVIAVSPPFLIPKLVLQVLFNLGEIVLMVLFALANGLTSITLGTTVAWSLVILLQFYFIYVVWLCYNYLKVLIMIEDAPNGYISQEPSSQLTNL